MKLSSDKEWPRRNAAGASLACLLCLAGLPAPSHSQEVAGPSDWQFAATIYGWFPDIGGHTELPLGGGGEIGVDISTILDHLKMTAQGSFEFRKGRWGMFTDIVYLDVGDSNSRTRNLEFNGTPVPAGVTADTNFDLKSTFWTVAASYGVAASDAATFDLLAGARLAHLKQELRWTFTGSFGPVTPPPTSGSRGTSGDQWDVIFGGKGRLMFGAGGKWSVPYYFDVGAGDSDLTWQAELGLAYSFGWGDLGVVWRYLDYDLESDGPIVDIDFDGPSAGVALRW